MTEAALEDGEQTPVAAYHPQRLAWGVLFSAFAIFCVLCATTTIVLQFFLFQSTVGLKVTLQPGRGTAIVRSGSNVLPPVIDARAFSRGMSVQTDSTDERAQASLIFHDDRYEERVLATVTLHSDSSVRLRSSSRPRFDWTVDDRYRVDLANLSGEMEVYVEDDLPLPIEINVWTGDGTRIILIQGGHYVINTTDTTPQITNWHGQAVMVPPDSNIGQSVGTGQQAALAADGTYVLLDNAPANLLENGGLSRFQPTSASDDVPDQPVAWQCTLTPNRLPQGRYEYALSPDGREAFRLVRGDDAAENSETSCEQPVDIDPTHLSHLEFRATLYIAMQSISACGILASECPLMLQIDYIGGDGGARSLRHGIYARLDPAADWPLLCDTCAGRDHVRVYEDAWYTYESGNLLPLMRVPDPGNADELLPPRSIERIRIYASGHQYDVFIKEVALIAQFKPEQILSAPITDQ